MIQATRLNPVLQSPPGCTGPWVIFFSFVRDPVYGNNLVFKMYYKIRGSMKVYWSFNEGLEWWGEKRGLGVGWLFNLTLILKFHNGWAPFLPGHGPCHKKRKIRIFINYENIIPIINFNTGEILWSFSQNNVFKIKIRKIEKWTNCLKTVLYIYTHMYYINIYVYTCVYSSELRDCLNLDYLRSPHLNTGYKNVASPT